MPTITIPATNVRGQRGAAPLAVVGSTSTMWGDGSDSTYASDYGVVNGTGVGTLFGDIAGNGLTITSAFATCRLKEDTSTRVAFGVTSFGDDAEIGYTIAAMADAAPYYNFTNLAATNTIQTLTLGFGDPSTGAAMTGAQLTALFASGFTLLARTAPSPPNSSTTITVYEFTVTITYAGETFQRVHPRDDALGTATVMRVWPKPTSQQSSSRQVGGYY